MAGPKDSYSKHEMLVDYYPAVKAVIGLIDAAERWQEERLDVGGDSQRWDFFTNTYSQESFVLELRTLRIGGPRQFGNSTAAAVAAHRLAAGLVVVPYVDQAGSVRNSCDQGSIFQPLSVVQVKNRVEAGECDPTKSIGPFNSIVVDGTSYIERNDSKFIKQLARLLDIDKKGWLVLIG